MTEFESLLLDMVKDIQRDVGEIKETQARMDERLKTLERPENDCVEKRIQALEKRSGPKPRPAAINISMAGVGAGVVGAIWAIVKLFTGVPPGP